MRGALSAILYGLCSGWRSFDLSAIVYVPSSDLHIVNALWVRLNMGMRS